MKRISFFLLIIILLASTDCAMAQGADTRNCDTIYNIPDSLVVLPDYKDGVSSFINFIGRVAKPAPVYTGSLIAKAMVTIECGIDKEGRAFNPSVKRIGRIPYDEHDKRYQEYDKYWKDDIDLDYCEKEAFRILSLVEFIPARVNGANVCVEGFITLISVYYAVGGYD